MSDVIDFNTIKNIASDKEIEKFEQYIYGLYYSIQQGKMELKEISKHIKAYMKDNLISEEKFKNIQSKLISKCEEIYGFNSNDLENHLKSVGVDINKFNFSKMDFDYDTIKKNLSFNAKFKEKIKSNYARIYKIKNNANDIQIILDEDNIILFSKEEIHLEDDEIKEFLKLYKESILNRSIKIFLCENCSTNEY